MRTIKFKAIAAGHKDWVYGSLTTDLTNTHKSIFQWERMKHGWSHEEYKILPETVCQFTGLFDKYGVEIYERDRIEWNGNIITVEYGIQSVDAFEGMGFNLWGHYGEKQGTCERMQNEIRVIGNIHDTPQTA